MTDAEVIGFVNTIDTIAENSKEELLVNAVEDTVENYCQRKFESQIITDEEHSIGREAAWHGLVIKPANQFRLKQFPITTFTELKFVTERDETTGAPSQTTVITRNRYHVDLETGVVTLLERPLDHLHTLGGNSFRSFPHGTAVLLATYTAGFVTTPNDLKVAILQIIARISRMRSDDSFTETQVFSEFGSTMWNRVTLTKEEMLFLDSFRNPVLV